ncbi:MAG: ABC transporter permease subunit [Thermotogae bacterium]|nr:ABC transporter permease subunit [Thermotogota bacterium]
MVRRSHRYLRETLKAYLFLLPSFIVLGIFLFWPLAFSFVLSFFRWDFAHQKNPYFIGLKNYLKLFELREYPDFSFLTSISHTLMYLSISVVILVLFHTLFIERRKVSRSFVFLGSILLLGFLTNHLPAILFQILWIAIFVAILFSLKKYGYSKLIFDKLFSSTMILIVSYIVLRNFLLPYGKDIISYLNVAKEGSEFIKAIYNTTYYVILSTPIGIALSLGVALLLNRITRLKAFYRTSYFIPFVTSIVAISLVWQWIFNDDYGLLNYVLSWFKLSKIAWLKDERWTIPTIAIVAIWKNLGYNAVIFLAGLQSIDKFYYEAAEVDGATTFQKFIHITWPLLSPTTFFILVVSMIGSFKVFTMVYVLYEGYPGPYNLSGLTMVYYVFRKFYEEQRMGEACAAAYMLFLIILVLTVFQLRIGKEKVQYEA